VPDDVDQLRERAKELACLYRVNDALLQRVEAPHVVFERVLAAMPEGWRHPETTRARLVYLGRHYESPGFVTHGARLVAPILTWNTEVGSIEVVDTSKEPGDESAFLIEEQALLDAIAARIGDYLEWKQQELIGEPIGAQSQHWKWRQEIAERLASSLDGERFGVEAIYLTGSTERGDAAPASDIDLVVVFSGTPEQRRDLSHWLEGWSLCLSEIAYRHGGSRISDGLLDVKWLSEAPSPRERLRMRELPLGTERA
jgi:hypothetical protein